MPRTLARIAPGSVGGFSTGQVAGCAVRAKRPMPASGPLPGMHVASGRSLPGHPREAVHSSRSCLLPTPVGQLEGSLNPGGRVHKARFWPSCQKAQQHPNPETCHAAHAFSGCVSRTPAPRKPPSGPAGPDTRPGMPSRPRLGSSARLLEGCHPGSPRRVCGPGVTVLDDGSARVGQGLEQHHPALVAAGTRARWHRPRLQAGPLGFSPRPEAQAGRGGVAAPAVHGWHPPLPGSHPSPLLHGPSTVTAAARTWTTRRRCRCSQGSRRPSRPAHPRRRSCCRRHCWHVDAGFWRSVPVT